MKPEILKIIQAGVEGDEKMLRAYAELLMTKVDDSFSKRIGHILDGSYKNQPNIRLAVNKVDIKAELIRRIKKKGFPIGYVRGEADGGYGWLAISEDKVIPLEYAAEEYEIKALTELSERDLLDLANWGTINKKEIEEFKEQAIEDFPKLKSELLKEAK